MIFAPGIDQMVREFGLTLLAGFNQSDRRFVRSTTILKSTRKRPRAGHPRPGSRSMRQPDWELWLSNSFAFYSDSYHTLP